MKQKSIFLLVIFIVMLVQPQLFPVSVPEKTKAVVCQSGCCEEQQSKDDCCSDESEANKSCCNTNSCNTCQLNCFAAIFSFKLEKFNFECNNVKNNIYSNFLSKQLSDYTSSVIHPPNYLV